MTRHHFLCCALCLAPLAGCASVPSHEPRMYPSGATLETLDVQVTRDETLLRLTNTSARDFGPSTLWVNKAFSLPIDDFAIGETLTLELSDFIDEHGNRFRAGGFFATRVPHDVVMVEIEDASGDRYGLIVVRGEAP